MCFVIFLKFLFLFYFNIFTFGTCTALPSLTSSSMQYKTSMVSAEDPRIDIVRWLMIKENIKMHINEYKVLFVLSL